MNLIDHVLPELKSQRRHVLGAIDGLDRDALTRSVPPTTWAPIAVVHHLALDVERWWFDAIVRGDVTTREFFEAQPHDGWTVPDGTDVLAVYSGDCARSDEIIAEHAFDDEPGWWPDFLGARLTVGEIALHVVAETATHAGHLDIVRESIDGATWLILD